jgi:hypothetical protein
MADINSRQIQDPSRRVERPMTLVDDEKACIEPAAAFTLRGKVTLLCSAK